MMNMRHGSESGATAVEYALIVALIAGVIFAVVGVFGTKTLGLFDKPCAEFSNVGQPC